MDTQRLWSLREHNTSMVYEELARRFLTLARKIALRYVGASDQLEDLVQAANLGLLQAIKRFEPARGNSFAAFAIPTIAGEIKRHFRTNGWAVHVPRGSQELALEIRTASHQLRSRLGRAPSVIELAQYTERDLDEVVDGLQTSNSQYADSLDAVVKEGDDDCYLLGETLGKEDDGYRLVDATSALADVVPKLPYWEREALMILLTENLTQAEIGRRLGCSQMQISRLIRRGRAHLREMLERSTQAPKT
jgi:RNA polymerase sigma-B factor